MVGPARDSAGLDRSIRPMEIVPLPDSGRVFSGTARAGPADVAPSGRVRLDVLARWIQDVSYADMEDASLVDLAVWVIRRMRIRVRRFPRLGEHCALHTFCSGLGRMWAERRTTIVPTAGGDSVVEAAALWVHLDPHGRRMTPLLTPELDTFAEAAGTRRVTARLSRPEPDGSVERQQWRFRHTECDLAGHVNNAAYLQPLEEKLLSQSQAEPDRIDLELEFRAPTRPGDTLILCDTRRWWIVGDRKIHATIVVLG